MNKSLRYALQIIITQAGTMNDVTWFELSKFYPHDRTAVRGGEKLVPLDLGFPGMGR